MKTLSVGSFNNINETSLHRNWALEKLGEVDRVNMFGCKVNLAYRIRNKLFNLGLAISLPDISNCNQKIIELVSNKNYDLVWIDKGLMVNPNTLKFIKRIQPNIKIAGYSPDNMTLRHNQSQNFLDSLPYYDYFFTNKSYILNDMKKLGVKKIFFMNNSYEPSFHYLRELSKEDHIEFGGDIGFVGFWEKERCEGILYLVNHGLKVKVFGDGKWNEYKKYNPNLIIKPALYSENYSRALQAFKISLCFLRKINHDLQTTRTIEIPACGGFMMAERTTEHQALFEENKEAVFFSNNEELLEKCKYYLAHEEKRKQIAQNGYEKCKIAGYDNSSTIKKMVNIALNNL